MHTDRRSRPASRVFRKLLFGICCWLGVIPPVHVHAGQQSACRNVDPMVFGILPFVSTEQLVHRFTPLAKYLSDHLQTEVRIETAADFATFARRSEREQRYDLLFTAPHFFAPAKRTGGYRLIVAVDSPGMRAVIVAPRNSDIHSLWDLAGKRLATLPPLALATLLIREHLGNAGIDPDRDLLLVTTPSHDASLLSAYHGVTDAAALMQPPYAAASHQIRNNMRIIASTRSTPHIPISVGPRVDDDCATEITDLLLRMSNTPEGRTTLRHNRFSGFRAADPEEYADLEALLPR